VNLLILMTTIKVEMLEIYIGKEIKSNGRYKLQSNVLMHKKIFSLFLYNFLLIIIKNQIIYSTLLI